MTIWSLFGRTLLQETRRGNFWGFSGRHASLENERLRKSGVLNMGFGSPIDMHLMLVEFGAFVVVMIVVA